MHITERYEYETDGGDPTVEFVLEGARFSHVAIKCPDDGPLLVRAKDDGGGDVRDYAFVRRDEWRTVAPAGDRLPRDLPADVLDLLMRTGFAVTTGDRTAGDQDGGDDAVTADDGDGAVATEGRDGTVAADGGAAPGGVGGRRPGPTRPEHRRSRRRFRNTIRAHHPDARATDAPHDRVEPATPGDGD